MRERAVQRLEIEGCAAARARCGTSSACTTSRSSHFARSEVIGFEALVRWEHPERGLLPPDEFLAIAEETGLIVPIGAWVLQEACAQAAGWRAESPDDAALTVSVNLSAAPARRPGARRDRRGRARRARTSIRRCSCSRSTRPCSCDDPDHAVDVLQALAKHGVRVGIDDFGTGQSSLGYLKMLPVHTLKIDRSFIDGLGNDAEDTAIVAAIVHARARARARGDSPKASRTRVQLDALRDLGCDLGQGYYFARPAAR